MILTATRFRTSITALLLAVVAAGGAMGPSMARALEPVPAADRAASTGSIVPIGGALRMDNTAVWSTLVTLAGGPGARFVVIPAASDHPARAGKAAAAALEAHGAQARWLPVSPALPPVSGVSAVDDPAHLAAVREARGLFFTGGAQERIVALLAPDGRPSPLLREIQALHARGGVVAGTSAGAAVMSQVMFRDAQSVHRVMLGQMREGQEIDRGLGFLPPEVFVDQHFLKRGRLGRMLPLMQARGIRHGIGVEEDSAVVVQGPWLEVVGARGALMVDLGDSRHDATLGAFHVQGARLSFLGAGDRLNWRESRIEPAQRKREGLVLNPSGPDFKPLHKEEAFHMDILGDNTVVQAMSWLMESRQDQVKGLAWTPALLDPALPRDIGFEFRLSRDARTRGWMSSASGAEEFTIVDMVLDVQPVRMATPPYRPLTPQPRGSQP